MSRPLTVEVKMFVINKALQQLTFIGLREKTTVKDAIKLWRARGFKNPETAAKAAVGEGGYAIPSQACSLGIGIMADNYSAGLHGYHVKMDDGQEGIVTYREIADVALNGRLADQLSLFEEATL